MPLSSRPARPEDHATFARLFQELELDDPVPDDAIWGHTWMSESLFIIDAEGVTVGYGWGQVLDDIGYIRHVITDSRHRRRGVGRAVMAALAARFAREGCSTWRLNVIDGNVAAIALYKRCGMTVAFATDVVRLDWEVLRRIAPGDSHHGTVRTLQSHEDDVVAIACGVEAGLLPKLRSENESAVVMAAFDDDGEPVGVLRFDPEFPRARPFRAPTPPIAKAMLEGVEARLERAPPTFEVVIEDDALLTDAFLRAGASRPMTLTLMEGRLPEPRG